MPREAAATPRGRVQSAHVSQSRPPTTVTHALLRSHLTDKGESLGHGARSHRSRRTHLGSDSGRGGDQEFRAYVTLKPDTREVLENSREFFRDHDNTVYHIGYPLLYRQAGKEPNIQFSMSADGLSGDIDVDYRSSKSPQSHVQWTPDLRQFRRRIGDNPVATMRWQGLVPWWQHVFGRVGSRSRHRGICSVGTCPTRRPRHCLPIERWTPQSIASRTPLRNS